MKNHEINWKQKLTSRKLWVAIASFVSMLIIAFGVSEDAATQVTSIIMAGASMIAYIIGEGLVDAQGVTGNITEGVAYLEEADDTEYIGFE